MLDPADHRTGMWRTARGQSSVQLVAVVPALLLVALVAAQALLAGYALWSAGVAARAGARSAHVGGEVRDNALRALPEALRRGARVREGPRGVRVRVAAPSLVPGVPELPLAATTALDPASGRK